MIEMKLLPSNIDIHMLERSLIIKGFLRKYRTTIFKFLLKLPK